MRFLKVAGLALLVAGTGFLNLTFASKRNLLGLPFANPLVPVRADYAPPNDTMPLQHVRASEGSPPPRSPALEVLIEAQGGSDFPVLVPTGFAASEDAIAASRLRLRLLNEGYYLVFRSASIEVTLIASRKAWTTDPELVPQPGAYVGPFEDPGPIPAGGAITFGHYGADYHVSFDCIDTSPRLRRNCITEDAARLFVEGLVDGTPTGLVLPDVRSS